MFPFHDVIMYKMVKNWNSLDTDGYLIVLLSSYITVTSHERRDQITGNLTVWFTACSPNNSNVERVSMPWPRNETSPKLNSKQRAEGFFSEWVCCHLFQTFFLSKNGCLLKGIDKSFYLKPVLQLGGCNRVTRWWSYFPFRCAIKVKRFLVWEVNTLVVLSLTYTEEKYPPPCLFNRLFRRRSKKTWKLRDTGLCAGNSPGTGEFPAQMASNAKNVSIWWRHHRHRLVHGANIGCSVPTFEFQRNRG